MGKKFLKVVLSLALSVSAVFANMPTVIHADTSSAEQSWDTFVATNAVNGAITINPESKGGNTFLVSDTNVTSFTLEADVSINSGSTEHTIGGFIFGSPSAGTPNSNNWIGLVLGYNQIRLFNESNWSASDGLEVRESISNLTADNKLRVEVVGKQITVYVNGTKVIEKQYDGYTGGRVGMMSHNTKAVFKNIKFTQNYQNSFGSVSANESSFETLSKGYKLNKIDGDNHFVSSISSKEFEFEGNIEFKDGNSASFIFGAQSNVYSEIKNNKSFFGLEFSTRSAEQAQDPDKVFIKLFQNHGIGDGVISGGQYSINRTTTGTKIPVKVKYTNLNGLEIWADGQKFSYSLSKDFFANYTGGYFGLLTWNCAAEFTDLDLTTIHNSGYFNTNLTGITSLTPNSGMIVENGYKVYAHNRGDRFILSNTTATNYTYEADFTFTSGNVGAAALLFDSSDSPNSDSHVANISRSENVMRLFKFDGGHDVTDPVALTNNKDTYHMKVQVLGQNITVWVDNVKIHDVTNATYPLNGGKLGLLIWNADVICQNLIYTPLDGGFITNLTGLPTNEANWKEEVTGLHSQGSDDIFALSTTPTPKAFTYEAEVNFTSTQGCASIMFNVGTNAKTASYVANINRENGLARLFKWTNNSAEDLIPNGVNVAIKDEYKLKVEVKSNGKIDYYIDGNLVLSATDTTHTGGVFALGTWNADVTYQNVKYKEKLHTNLSNLTGILNATYLEDSTGATFSSSGDAFGLFDEISGTNFRYEANIQFKAGDGAATLIFHSKNDPTKGSYAINMNKAGNVRFFKWPSTDNIATAKVDTNDSGSYHFCAEVFGSTTMFYINDKLVFVGEDIEHTTGRLGLLTYNSTITYQDVYYTELKATDRLALEDLKVSGINVVTTPTFDSKTNVYTTTIPAGTNEILVKARANEDIKLTYELTANGVTYDKTSSEATPTNMLEETLTPINGTSELYITMTKGQRTSIVKVSITKHSSALELSQEDYRPQVHFSPEINFMNDPNGLVYDPSNDTWHMFYQYSPQVNNMGSQTWGHAVSDDLVNWVELPVAIPMDKFGAVFSGSCVVDEKDTSGFFTDNLPGESKLVAIYTSAGSYGMVQNIAYSKDHGVTWTKIEKEGGRPTIEDTYHDGFRDPKVFKIDGDDKDLWYMVIAGGRARLFTSPDLKNWTLLQELNYANGSELHSECPGLYPLEVLDRDGNKTGVTKWVYNASSEFYVIGDMVEDVDGYYRFVAETNAVHSQTGGASEAYAAQTYYNDGTGQGRIMTVHWLRDYSAPNHIPTKGWNGIQTFPLETTLKKLDDGSYLVCQNPVEEVDALRGNVLFEDEDVVVSEDSVNILSGITGQVYEVEATIDMANTTAKEFGFELRVGSGEKMQVKYDVNGKKMTLQKVNSTISYEADTLSYTLTPTSDGKIKLHAYVDQSVIETFGNDGETYLIDLCYPSPSAVGMSFYSVGGDTAIDDITVYELKSIYTKEEVSKSAKETYISLASPSTVDAGEEFTVTANVYPMTDIGDIEWTIPTGLSKVSETSNSVTLKATTKDSYTIKAKVNGEEVDTTVSIIERNFNTNLVDWGTASGNWEVVENGVRGNNAGNGDSFYMSDTYLAGDKAWSFEADMDMRGRAAGITIGVGSLTSPQSKWFCLNSDTVENGGHFKFFKNTGSQNWSVTAAYGDFAETTKYRLKITYDGNGKFEFFAAPYGGTSDFTKLGEKEDTTFAGGYFGVMTFQSDTTFNNVMLYTDDDVKQDYSNVEVVKPNNVEFDEDTLDAAGLLELLPNVIRVIQENGVERDIPVTWDVSEVDFAVPGTYNIHAFTKERAGTKLVTINAIVNDVPLDTVEYENAMNRIVDADADDFTASSVQAVLDANDKVMAILDDQNAEQEELDEAVEALNKAIDELVTIKSLKETVKEYADTTTSKYTEESAKAFKDALEKANAVLEDEDATQDEVDAAEKALVKAYKALEKKPVDTGDNTNVGGSLALMLLSLGVLLSKKRKDA